MILYLYIVYIKINISLKERETASKEAVRGGSYHKFRKRGSIHQKTDNQMNMFFWLN
jgi:hypothetical protein